MASTDDLARALVDRARDRGQAVVRCDATIPVDEVRARVRSLARDAGMPVRTAMIDDVLAVARVDAELWSDDTPTMRAKLAAPGAVGEVG